MAQSNEQGDGELRKQVILKLGYIRFEQGLEAWQRLERDVMQLILADRKQHELEARIDELDSAIMHTGKRIPKKDLDVMLSRLSRLKSERSKS